MERGKSEHREIRYPVAVILENHWGGVADVFR